MIFARVNFETAPVRPYIRLTATSRCFRRPALRGIDDDDSSTLPVG